MGTAFIIAGIVGLCLGGIVGSIVAMGVLWLVIFVGTLITHR